MNIICLMGRLTADVELKKTANDTSVASFTIAVDRRFTSQGQEKQADFINCVAWRQTAEFISKYFRKGQRIALQGALQARKYTDKDGNNRTAFEVVVDNAEFCEGKSDRSEQSAPLAANSISTADYAQSAHTTARAYTEQQTLNADDFVDISADDELPF